MAGEGDRNNPWDKKSQHNCDPKATSPRSFSNGLKLEPFPNELLAVPGAASPPAANFRMIPPICWKSPHNPLLKGEVKVTVSRSLIVYPAIDTAPAKNAKFAFVRGGPESPFAATTLSPSAV